MPRAVTFPVKRAQWFQSTRDHHSLEAAEDYTELVLDLIDTKGTAKVCDIATQLGISHVTALRTLRRLTQAGFVKTAKQQPVSLTRKGESLARFARGRHATLIEFFAMLGVPKDIAAADVEGAEHHISNVSMQKIRAFMRRMKSANALAPVRRPSIIKK